ncbi:unnamed protein product, partial [Mesorhabditis spiculigera]
MQAYFAFIALLGFICQQAFAADCATKPATSPLVEIGPAIDGVCPTGLTCYIRSGTNYCYGTAPITDCTDKNSNCATWISNGFCKNPAYTDVVAQYCPKGCKLCTAPAPCVDLNSNCKTWVANNFCTNPAYANVKNDYCPKSCGGC